MIKVEIDSEGMKMEVSGEAARLLTEFTAIIEQFHKRGILNEDIYGVCWKMATLTGEEKKDFNGNTIKNTITEMTEKNSNRKDDLIDELENIIKSIKED